MGKQFNIRDMPKRSDERLRQLVEWTGRTKVQIMLLGLDKLWLEEKRERAMDTGTQIDFSAILEAFLESPDFGEGCKAATKASWNGSGYSVELAPNGVDGWRVLWNNQIGNKYNSLGEIIGLPTLDDDDYQECVVADDAPMTEDDYFLSVFQNDEEELKQYMRDKLAGVA